MIYYYYIYVIWRAVLLCVCNKPDRRPEEESYIDNSRSNDLYCVMYYYDNIIMLCSNGWREGKRKRRRENCIDLTKKMTKPAQYRIMTNDGQAGCIMEEKTYLYILLIWTLPLPDCGASERRLLYKAPVNDLMRRSPIDRRQLKLSSDEYMTILWHTVMVLLWKTWREEGMWREE